MNRALAIALLAAALGGCSSPPRADVARLLAHPQAETAAKAAPDFFTDAMQTIARLDHELNAANK